MKSSQPPDLAKVFANRPTNEQIKASRDRALSATGHAWPDRLKPNAEQNIHRKVK
jgi:hypothetical protein